jgi:hypothetical protein
MDNDPSQPTPTSTHTTINHTDAKPSGGSNVIWFLLGGIVIVIAIAAYFVLGQGAMPTLGSSAPTGGNVSVDVESTSNPPPDAALEEAAPAETTPPAD